MIALITGCLFHTYSSRSLPVANTRRNMWQRPNRRMQQLRETINQGVDIACGCICHYICPSVLCIAHIHSGFVMIAWICGLGMRVSRYTRSLWGVGVLAMPDMGLGTTRHVESVFEVPRGACQQRLVAPSMGVGVFVRCRCVADTVEVTHSVICQMRELFSKDEGVEFWPWIIEAMELPPEEESLLLAGMAMRHVAERSSVVPKGAPCCWFWQFARLRTFCTTGVMSRWGLSKSVVPYRCSMVKMSEYFPLHACATAGNKDLYLSEQRGIWQRWDAQCRLRSTLHRNNAWQRDLLNCIHICSKLPSD
jgi:hypothetical protein